MLIHLFVLINTAYKVREHIVFTEVCNYTKGKMLVKNIQTDSWLEIIICLWLHLLISSMARNNKVTPQEDHNVGLCDKPLPEDEMLTLWDGGEKTRYQVYPAPPVEVSVQHLLSPDHLNP